MAVLRLFGPPAIEGEEGPRNGRAAQRHRLALLALLSTAPSRQLSRDKLLAYLWPWSDARRARHLLNVSVHVLRRELGEEAILSAGDDLRLNTKILSSDVVEFEEALGRGDAERAAELYAAPFLDGFYLNGSVEFERWLDGERDRLAGLCERALESLAAEGEAKGDTERAVKWWRTLATHNPYSGRVAAGLMRALEATGDHGAAIRHAHAHIALLKKELGAEPDPEVLTLVERLKTDPNGRSANEVAGRVPASTWQGDTGSDEPRHRPVPLGSNAGPFRTFVRRNGRIPRGAMAAGAFTVLIATIAATVILVFSKPQERQFDQRRILVAEFENRTGDASLDHLGRMASDWIQQALARTDLVEVVDQATAVLSSNHVAEEGELEDTARIEALADETSAGTIVSGSFYREANSLVFLATVTDANTGELLLGMDPVRGPVAKPLEGIESLREEVLGGLAMLFDERLTSLTSTSTKPPTFEAYLTFMGGLDAYVRRDNKAAVKHFHSAAALDTTFVLPLLWSLRTSGGGWNPADRVRLDSILQVLVAKREQLSPLDQYALDYHLAARRADRSAQLQSARRAAEIAPQSDWTIQLARVTNALEGPAKAIAILETLDPDRGWMKEWPAFWEFYGRWYHLLGEHQRELQMVREGRKRHPVDPRLFALEIEALAALGYVEEIEHLIEDYILLPPQPPFTPGGMMGTAAQDLRAHGHPVAARGLQERAVAWYEAHPPEDGDPVSMRRHRWSLAFSLYKAGRLDEAQPVFEDLVDELPVGALGYLGCIAVQRGDRATARIYQARLEEFAGSGPEERWAGYWQARIALLRGEPEHAIELLSESAGNLDFLPYFLHRDEAWEGMRSVPEIQRLMRPWDEAV